MIYDRRTVLSLKLRSSMYLRKLSRAEFFTRLQVIRKLDPMTDEAYKQVEEETWRLKLDDAPHGDPWHVSFHASQFPGNDPMACPRQALYRMMDFARPEPFTRRSRSIMAAGKAIEIELVRTYERAGWLLSAGPDEKIQTGFEIPEAWLTGSVDCILKPPRWNKPLPVEVKTKSAEDIKAMQLGVKGPDEPHIKQIKVEIALVRHFQPELWPGLDPVTHGYLYYLSRDNPSETAEFRVDFDPVFFEMGIDRLKQWQAWFREGFLPEMAPGKRDSKFGHPNGWRWSYQPCAWCDYKKTCQLDFREGVTDLMESAGVTRTKLHQKDYDPKEARQRVFDRWRRKSGKISSTNDPVEEREQGGPAGSSEPRNRG